MRLVMVCHSVNKLYMIFYFCVPYCYYCVCRSGLAASVILAVDLLNVCSVIEEDIKLECGLMPNVMATMPNIGVALC